MTVSSHSGTKQMFESENALTSFHIEALKISLKL